MSKDKIFQIVSFIASGASFIFTTIAGIASEKRQDQIIDQKIDQKIKDREES